MKIDRQVLDQLSEEAKRNPRLRQAYDLRTDTCDNSQRMLNALEPGTVIPVHRHRDTTETLVMVRGSLREFLYDDEGNVTDTIELAAGAECSVLQIEKGCWHSLECMESGTVIFEAKNGAYAPLTDEDVMK